MVDITEISAVVAAAGVMIGVVYYILEIRHQARTRQTDLVMKLYSEIGSKEYVEAYPHFYSLVGQNLGCCFRMNGSVNS